jgi:hypothetical protein
MPYLRFHSAPETESAALPLRFSTRGVASGGLQLASSRRPDVIGQVERAMDLVDRRLENLRALVDQFGLDDDDGPRAA